MRVLVLSIENYLSRMTSLAALITRVSIGFVFFQTGWGKLHHLDKVIEFFHSLGIPAAQFQAPFVASVETLGGLLLIFGLYTRFAAIPLMGTMVVAILTAKRGDIGEVADLFKLMEYLYLVLLVWLATYGAGTFSLDRIVRKK